MFNAEYDNFRPRFEEVMSKYASMWEGQLGGVPVITHKIDLTDPDMRPVHSNSYRAGPIKRQLEREDINKMLQDDFAESVIIE